MKRWIHASTDVSDIKKKISSALFDFIRFELNDQVGYYKQIRKQFTVNGKKYVVKNDAKGRLNVINPEGENLYGYAVPSSNFGYAADDIASEIVNDAFGEDIDLENKKVHLNMCRGYTSYGSNSAGDVIFGPYVDELRRYGSYQRDPDPGKLDGRYISLQIKAWWSGNDEYLYFSDDANELIRKAKKFISDGAVSSRSDGTSNTFIMYRAIWLLDGMNQIQLPQKV